MNDLDNYEILSIIGEGTFGVVKLGEEKSTGEKVAIKILEKKKMTSLDDKERVEREIEILEKINHINVIKIIKIIKNPDNIYIIMEFCENGELFSYIVEKQNLDEEEAAYYYYQLINGLECLHHYGIVHRDLKPENLLLSKKNILKIIDFGLSNYYNEIDLLSTPCGSPSYASPEMVSGNKYDGFLIDIWSSGIILYAMLCGFLPFEDQDNEILFKKIYECKVEFPNDISKDAIDLMKKIMVSDPKKRITLNEIKNHKFFLKGKKKFKKLHPRLVKEVEKTYEEKIEYIKEGQKKEENINQIKNEKFKEKKNEQKSDFDSKGIIDFNSSKKIIDIKTEKILDLNEKKGKLNKAIEVKKDNKNNDKIKDLMNENRDELNDSIKNNKDKKINENKPNKKEINNNEFLNNNFHTKNNNKSKKDNINYNLSIGKQNDKINLNEYKNNIDNKELLIDDNKLDIIQNEINHNNKLNKEMNINKDNIKELKNSNYNFNTKKDKTEHELIKNSEKKINTNYKIINQDNNNDNLYNNIQNKNNKDSINNNAKKNQIGQINSIAYNKIKRIERLDKNDNNINNKIPKEKVSENHNINLINKDDNLYKIENLKFIKHKTLDEEKYNSHTLDINKNKYIKKAQKIDKKTLNKNIYLPLEDNNNKIIYYQKIYMPNYTEKLSTKKKNFITEKINSNIIDLNNNNSTNIQSNLKNKINIDKNSHTQKFDDSIKEKIPQKLRIIKNEKIRYRNTGNEQSRVNNTINNKIPNSMYNSRLTENEKNYYHKVNIMNSTKKNMKLNNNAILYSKKQNEKKKNIRNNLKTNQKNNGNNQRICYKSENIIYKSIRDNHLYSNLFNNDDKIISDSNEIIQNQNINHSMKINYIKNNINPKINNGDMINYSMKNTNVNMNPKNTNGKNIIHLNKSSQKYKITKISLQNDKILKYNNQTYNPNINTYNIPNRYTSNNINKYRHIISISPNNEDLLEDINYRRKFVTEKYDFQTINTSKAQVNMKTLNLFDKRSLNINKLPDKYNYYNEDEFINNYTHKKNIINYNLLKENSMHNQKLSINKTPKANMINKDFISFNSVPERRKYNIASSKDNLTDRKLIKYISNDIFNQNINLKLGNFSNSMENYYIKKYSHKNLYPTNQEYNNMKKMPLTSITTNSTNNKYLYNNNINTSRNNKNYSKSEVKEINNTKNLNNRIIRKGIALSTINDNNIYNDNCNINTNKNIYNTKTNLKYLSNYNLNGRLNNINETEYSQFNKAQINSKNIFLNKILDINRIDINENSLEGFFQYGYNNIKKNNLYKKSREKNKRNNNLFLQENNRSTQNNINNNIMNNYINIIEIDKYNSKNPIKIKKRHIKNSNLRVKKQYESIENTNDNSENLLIKLINSKVYKRQKTLGSENLNNKKFYQKIEKKGNPLSFLSLKDINNERSEYYYTNNITENINNSNLNNISKSIENYFQSKSINTSKKSNYNKYRVTMNLNNNYNYIFNNN